MPSLATKFDPPRTPSLLGGKCRLTEEEAEWLECTRTGGKAGERFEAGVVFGLIGLGSAATVFVFSWVVFKKVWFVWLGMPGWW